MIKKEEGQCIQPLFFFFMPKLTKPSRNIHVDPTARRVAARLYYQEKINLIEKIAKETDEVLYLYMWKRHVLRSLS